MATVVIMLQFTPARVTAGLRRVESRMRRGHESETTQEISDPHFGMDVETWTQLAPIVVDRNLPRNRQLAAIETRHCEVEALPRINPRRGLRGELAAVTMPLTMTSLHREPCGHR